MGRKKSTFQKTSISFITLFFLCSFISADEVLKNIEKAQTKI